MKLLTFDSQHLDVDWISFNIQGLTDPKTIASNLSKQLTLRVLIDDESKIGFHGFKKNYKVSVRQYKGSKGYYFFLWKRCGLFL